ncbi:putative F-box/FBD/LRR-repeat protein At4g03220 [Magnolia sinica]|uniref:putative F-box/FBD/LRR-repeat protein At4g03220 n=1 Tax=Magnolia sinica TaxID=86752 RepID=UPI0026587CAE|nr:putative F-box/FBD/LRR-repeat protein At4g03220 [Magnolia sinica]
MPTSFSHLRFLKLSIRCNKDQIHVIIFLLKRCPNLETLVIDIVELYRWYSCKFKWGEDIESGQSVFKCMMYHLKKVEIRHFGGHENEIEFVKVFLKNAKALQKVCIRFRQGLIDLRMQTKISEMILALPRTSSNVVMLFS